MIALPLLVALTGYPTDAAAAALTGIRRLAPTREASRGAPGGEWSLDKIRLRMTAHPDYQLAEIDPELQLGLDRVAGRHPFRAYGIALLDLSNPARPRYAARRPDLRQTPGSTAKLLVAAALFAELARTHPDIDDRTRYLRDHSLVASPLVFPAHHAIPVVREGRLRTRPPRVGDRFSIWEWLDHAISPSSNAAATLLWLEALRLRGFPGELTDGDARRARTEAAFAVLDDVLRSADLPVQDLQLRGFFSRPANRTIFASASRFTPKALLQWMLRVEQGRVVDGFSSLELKRLMYVTRRRIRYAYAKELRNSAVFFKSGSLYACRAEETSPCAKYRGSRVNVLNSVTAIETPEGQAYIAVVMSNVLRRNASQDHAQLAGEIHRLVVTSTTAP
ncbi:MAG: serine hydrolase [Myxococcota bacterium]